MKLYEILNKDQMEQLRKIVRPISTFIQKEKTQKRKFFINIFKDRCRILFLLNTGNLTYMTETKSINPPKYRTYMEIFFDSINNKSDDIQNLCCNKLDEELVLSKPVYELPEFKLDYKQFNTVQYYTINKYMAKALLKHSEFSLELIRKYPIRDTYFCSIIEQIKEPRRVFRISSTDGCCMVTEKINDSLANAPEHAVIISPYVAKIHNAIKSTSEIKTYKKPIAFGVDLYGTEDLAEFDNIRIYRVSVSRSKEKDKFDLTYPKPSAVIENFVKSGWGIYIEEEHIKTILSRKYTQTDRIILNATEKMAWLLTDNNSAIKEIIWKNTKEISIQGISQSNPNFYIERFIAFLNFMKKIKHFCNKLSLFEEHNKQIYMADHYWNTLYETEDISFYIAPVLPITI